MLDNKNVIVNKVAQQGKLPTIQSAYSKMQAENKEKLSGFERFALWLTRSFGTVWSLILHFIWFGGWIFINLGLTPIKPFDPYPFGFLTLIVSLEAIFFSIIILIAENMEEHASNNREQMSIELLKLLEIRLDLLIKHQIYKDLQANGVSSLAKGNAKSKNESN